ncbi:hypothetical protein ACSQ67_008191 [Phaseolus vulgaris]
MVSRFGSSEHNWHHRFVLEMSSLSACSSHRQKDVALLLIEAIFFAAIILVTMLVLHGTTRRSLVVGIICDVFNVMIDLGLIQLLLYGFYYCRGENIDEGVELQSTTQVPISECPRTLKLDFIYFYVFGIYIVKLCFYKHMIS